MGAYIRDMQKPKSCAECQFEVIDTSGYPRCVIIQEMVVDGNLFNRCPLEEVDDIAFGLYKAYMDGIGGERGLDPNNCKECEVDECDRHICLKAVRERRKRKEKR